MLALINAISGPATLNCGSVLEAYPLWRSEAYPVVTIGWGGSTGVGYLPTFYPMAVGSLRKTRKHGCAFHAIKYYGNCSSIDNDSCGTKVLVGTESGTYSAGLMYLELGIPSAKASGFAQILNFAEVQPSPPTLLVRAIGHSAPPTPESSIVLAASLMPDGTLRPERTPLMCPSLAGTWYLHRETNLAVHSNFEVPSSSGR